MLLKRIHFSLFVLLLDIFFLPGAMAQTATSGGNINTFNPNMDGLGYFYLEEATGLNEGEFHLSLTQMAAHQNLLDVNSGGSNQHIIESLSANYLVAAYGINNRVSIGGSLPYYYWITGKDITNLASFTSQALGDTRFNFKINLLEETESQPALALKIVTDFPSGDDGLLIGDEHIVPGFDFIISKDFGYLKSSANLGMRFPWQNDILGIQIDDRFVYGLGVSIPFKQSPYALEFVGETFGHIQYKNVSAFTSPIEFMAGLRKQFQSGISVFAGAGSAWTYALGNPRLRGVLGLSYNFNVFSNTEKQNPKLSEASDIPQPIVASERRTETMSHEQNNTYKKIYELAIDPEEINIIPLTKILNKIGVPVVAQIQISYPLENNSSEKIAIQTSEELRNKLLTTQLLNASQVSFTDSSWQTHAQELDIRICLFEESKQDQIALAQEDINPALR